MDLNEVNWSDKVRWSIAFLGMLLLFPLFVQAQAEQQKLKIDAHALESPEPLYDRYRFMKYNLSSRHQVSDSVLSEFKLPGFTSVMGFEIAPGHFFYHLGAVYDFSPLQLDETSKLPLLIWEDTAGYSTIRRIFFAFDINRDNEISEQEIFESNLGEDKLVFLNLGTESSFKLPILVRIDKVYEELSVDMTNVLISSCSFQLGLDKIDAYFYHSPYMSKTFLYKNGELFKNGRYTFFEILSPFLIDETWYYFSSLNPLESTVVLNKLSSGEMPYGDCIGCYINYTRFKSVLSEKDSLNWINFSNKYFVVHFWGPWCRPCVKELPDVKALEQSLSGLDHVRLIHIACLGGERENSRFDELVFKYQLLAPHFIESTKDLWCYEGNNKYRDGCSLLSVFNNSSFPTYYVIDDLGKILYKGKLNEDVYTKIVELVHSLDK